MKVFSYIIALSEDASRALLNQNSIIHVMSRIDYMHVRDNGV